MSIRKSRVRLFLNAIQDEVTKMAEEIQARWPLPMRETWRLQIAEWKERKNEAVLGLVPIPELPYGNLQHWVVKARWDGCQTERQARSWAREVFSAAMACRTEWLHGFLAEVRKMGFRVITRRCEPIRLLRALPEAREHLRTVAAVIAHPNYYLQDGCLLVATLAFRGSPDWWHDQGAISIRLPFSIIEMVNAMGISGVYTYMTWDGTYFPGNTAGFLHFDVEKVRPEAVAPVLGVLLAGWPQLRGAGLEAQSIAQGLDAMAKFLRRE